MVAAWPDIAKWQEDELCRAPGWGWTAIMIFTLATAAPAIWSSGGAFCSNVITTTLLVEVPQIGKNESMIEF